MLSRILIANRGEIAVRIIRCCREMGLEAAAVYSDADADALHVRLADYAAHIGPSAAAESYLNVEAVLRAARELNCDALHPGYGFLAENADFAQAVLDAGLVWIGPPPDAMRRMGLKVAAREVARQAGVPVVPGYESAQADAADLSAAADGIGYPVLVKASAGGGGKGMRLVETPAALDGALAAARREAQAAFGDATVYLEKYIASPRHIEVQVLADAQGGVVQLGERECSVQRRHQKLVEETPSVAVDAALRAELGAHAVAIARAAGYVSAGTVEFMLAPDGSYYFLEMNTRLQVEHPVTELVYGLDLVRAMVEIAGGSSVEQVSVPVLEQSAGQSKTLVPPVARGHSIEVRICAEDPAQGFLPQTGRIELLREPRGPGVRVDSALYEGLEITPDYDPLLSKLIVHAQSRAAALDRLTAALREYRILGVTTNLPFLLDVVSHPAFRAGELSTGFVAEHMADWQPQPADDVAIAAAALLLGRRGASRGAAGQGRGVEAGAPALWSAQAGWSNT